MFGDHRPGIQTESIPQAGAGERTGHEVCERRVCSMRWLQGLVGRDG